MSDDKCLMPINVGRAATSKHTKQFGVVTHTVKSQLCSETPIHKNSVDLSILSLDSHRA
jgi:hypothetical protein